MAKKVQLTALKVKSFVVPMDSQAQKTAKGGIRRWQKFEGMEMERERIEQPAFRLLGPFTEHKSQRNEVGFRISRRVR